MNQRSIDKLEIGFRSSFSKAITEADIQKFAEVSGDYNPIHLDEEAARKTIFGGRIAHGMLTLGLVSAALARLPGVVVYLRQSVQFLRPVRIGDVIEAVVEVVDKNPEKGEAGLKTYCQNQRGEMVLNGEARVKIF